MKADMMKSLRAFVRQVGPWRLLVLAFVIVATSVAPMAQSVYNDLRHEVTLRNDPQGFSCTIVNSSATTLTALGGQCAAPTSGQSLYITDVMASASVISAVTADNYLELKSGTGGSCGTTTAVVWASYNTAFGSVASDFQVPIKVAANSELCWMDAAAGSKTFIVTGYIK